jgi:hypothetical protein
MARKDATLEKIISLLRQVEIELAQGHGACPRCRAGSGLR